MPPSTKNKIDKKTMLYPEKCTQFAVREEEIYLTCSNVPENPLKKCFIEFICM